MAKVKDNKKRMCIALTEEEYEQLQIIRVYDHRNTDMDTGGDAK